MENRLSKYYEQLFLDVYDFELNNIENPGAEHLFVVWGVISPPLCAKTPDVQTGNGVGCRLEFVRPEAGRITTFYQSSKL